MSASARPCSARARERCHGCRSPARRRPAGRRADRSEEHTSELQSLMRISYAVFCLKKKNQKNQPTEMLTTLRYDNIQQRCCEILRTGVNANNTETHTQHIHTQYP